MKFSGYLGHELRNVLVYSGVSPDYMTPMAPKGIMGTSEKLLAANTFHEYWYISAYYLDVKAQNNGIITKQQVAMHERSENK